MAISHSINYDLKDINKTEIDNLKKYHIRTAKESLWKAQAEKVFLDDNPRQRVDNVWDRELQNVRFIGKIEFYERVSDIKAAILQIFDLLIERSRVGSLPNRYAIKYKERHVIQINGKAIGSPDELDQFKFGDVVQIVNLAPYARRLELMGVTSRNNSANKARNKTTRKGKDSKGRSVILSRPNGTYNVVYRLARSRFKQIGAIKFEFLPMSAIGFSFKGDGRSYLYPSIKIIPSDAGAVQ